MSVKGEAAASDEGENREINFCSLCGWTGFAAFHACEPERLSAYTLKKELEGICPRCQATKIDPRKWDIGLLLYCRACGGSGTLVNIGHWNASRNSAEFPIYGSGIILPNCS